MKNEFSRKKTPDNFRKESFYFLCVHRKTLELPIIPPASKTRKTGGYVKLFLFFKVLEQGFQTERHTNVSEFQDFTLKKLEITTYRIYSRISREILD